MAHGAVLKHRRTQIVKRRRHDARHFGGSWRHRRIRKVRVAFQADESNVGAYQHPRIRRAMRLMTRLTAFETHGSVFKGERPALISMAAEASWLIGREGLKHGGPNTAVRIMAVDAAH